jgi:hypothetical protein
MFAHWRYVLDNVFAPVKSVSCLGAIHVKHRWDESGKPYQVTADDSAYATFELAGGIIAQFNSSWAVRVRRDDLLTLQVDGTKGSAVCGLRQCWTQSYAATPRPFWNPDIDNPISFLQTWTPVPEYQAYDNAFKTQWELFCGTWSYARAFPVGSAGRSQGCSVSGEERSNPGNSVVVWTSPTWQCESALQGRKWRSWLRPQRRQPSEFADCESSRLRESGFGPVTGQDC